jgi:dienelactone hydrolase
MCFVLSFSLTSFAQRKITFTAADHLTVTADLYRVDKNSPHIILFHGENESRGEYRDIAPKLQKLGFNCLAVDLRYGKESNYIRNETSELARQKDFPSTMSDCEKDMVASIDYISKTSHNQCIILIGSTFSASLAMKIANQDKKIAAVAAFSPGEYFGPTISVREWLSGFNTLLFVATTQHEYPFVTNLLENIPQSFITRFQPSFGNGAQGIAALHDINPTSNECWMSLMVFLKKVKDTKNE